jgi:hypothetical protein
MYQVQRHLPSILPDNIKQNNFQTKTYLRQHLAILSSSKWFAPVGLLSDALKGKANGRNSMSHSLVNQSSSSLHIHSVLYMRLNEFSCVSIFIFITGNSDTYFLDLLNDLFPCKLFFAFRIAARDVLFFF